MEWQPIDTAPEDELTKVDLWIDIPVSLASFDSSDAFRVTDAYRVCGKWIHFNDRGMQREINSDYITHWMLPPEPPKEKPSEEG